MSEITDLPKKRQIHSASSDPAIITISQKIRQRRIDIGMTQEQLALIAGVGRDFIIQLENGKPGVAFGKVCRVLHVLGLSLSIMES
ncbi:MAG: type II toxin-antitoxin system Y4mF family antitoxin [Gammaproteobacteria bacterium]